MNTLNFIDRFHIWRKKIKWNRQYRNGKWDYLKTEKEAPRYAKISEIIKTYSKEKPHVLDLVATPMQLISAASDPCTSNITCLIIFSAALRKIARLATEFWCRLHSKA